MYTSLAIAALAAGALAVPYKRNDVVGTTVDMVYVTDVVTVTAGAQATSSSIAEKFEQHNHEGRPYSSGWTTSSIQATSIVQSVTQAPTTYVAPAPTSTTPVYTPPASTYTPEPETTTSTQAWFTLPAIVPTTYAPSPATSEAPVSSSSSGAPSDYSSTVVAQHNLHRANHSASDIEWDDGLYQSALTIAQTCIYKHVTNIDGGDYGQNIEAGTSPSNVASIITNEFYNNEAPKFAGLYGQASPDMSGFEDWGHFSQLVWKATTHVGCATVDCSGSQYGGVGSPADASDPNSAVSLMSGVTPYYTVCNYKSAGNFAGQYANNIGEPLGHAEVTA